MTALFAIAYLIPIGLIAGCASNARIEAPPASSYACQTNQISGAATLGEGLYGCHFYLHHPETHQILANTAYRLLVYPSPANGAAHPAPILTLEGVTDAQGRSGYARAPFPITPDKMQFVEKIGSGPYGATPRLISPVTGLALPGMTYHVAWCGTPYTGVTDELGNGAAFNSTKACAIDVDFYRKR